MRGSGEDRLQSVQQSSDGGYILGGYPTSGVSGNKTNAGFGGWDFWAIKVASAENKQWEAVTEKMIVAKAAECLLPLRQGLWTSEPPAAARVVRRIGRSTCLVEVFLRHALRAENSRLHRPRVILRA